MLPSLAATTTWPISSLETRLRSAKEATPGPVMRATAASRAWLGLSPMPPSSAASARVAWSVAWRCMIENHTTALVRKSDKIVITAIMCVVR